MTKQEILERLVGKLRAAEDTEQILIRQLAELPGAVVERADGQDLLVLVGQAEFATGALQRIINRVAAELTLESSGSGA
jgi:hypothetical protein